MDIIHAQTAVELKSAPINKDWIIEGDPQARNGFVSGGSDGGAYTLVWECTEGKFHWYYDIDETIYILEGNVVLTKDNGEVAHLKAGDVVFFPYGSHARWHVQGYVRKVAFCRDMLPKPVRLAHKVYRKLASFLVKRPQSALAPA